MSAAGEVHARRRIYSFAVLAVILAAVFVRLGVWQLDRLEQRRALNAARRASHRDAFVRGTPDYANEIVLTGRSRNGSPGVHLVTPIRVRGSDTATLVNRGWVYAADAATVDGSRWRESRDAFRGYTRQLDTAAAVVSRGRSMRSLNRAVVRGLLPYPVHETYVVSQDSTASNAPARLPPPDLGEGPHLGYAIQWFAFAAIALVGAASVVLRARRSMATGPTGA